MAQTSSSQPPTCSLHLLASSRGSRTDKSGTARPRLPALIQLASSALLATIGMTRAASLRAVISSRWDVFGADGYPVRGAQQRRQANAHRCRPRVDPHDVLTVSGPPPSHRRCLRLQCPQPHAVRPRPSHSVVSARSCGHAVRHPGRWLYRAPWMCSRDPR